MDKVVWTLQALEDLAEIGLFIERDSPHFAEALVNRIYSSVERLVKYPLSGRQVPELNVKSTRELIVSGYRVVYKVHEQAITVLAVISGRQSLQKKLESS